MDTPKLFVLTHPNSRIAPDVPAPTTPSETQWSLADIDAVTSITPVDSEASTAQVDPTATDATTDPLVRLVIGLVILSVMIAAAFWVMAKFFGDPDQTAETPEPMLSNLEEMLARGDISEEEFRRISDSARQRDLRDEPGTEPTDDPPPRDLGSAT